MTNASAAQQAQGAVQIFATVGAAQAASVGAGVAALRIEGFSQPGDGGGAHYVRMDGSSPMLTAPSPSAVEPWNLQTADGAWWLLFERGPVNFQMFGALGNGNDDTAAIQAAVIRLPLDQLGA